MCVCVCVCVCVSYRPHGKIRLPPDGFSWNVLSIPRKSLDKIQILLKFDNDGYFTWRPRTLIIVSRWILHRMKNVSDEFVEKIKKKNTRFMLNNFSPENIAVYGIMWKKFGTARQATDDNIIWRMRIACWVTKDTHRHSEYLLLFHGNKITRTRLSIRIYIHCPSHLHRLCFSHCNNRFINSKYV